MAKKTFFVLEPLRHDAEDYAIGSKIALEAKEAASLLAAGVLGTDGPVVAEEAEPVVDAESPAE